MKKTILSVVAAFALSLSASAMEIIENNELSVETIRGNLNQFVKLVGDEHRIDVNVNAIPTDAKSIFENDFIDVVVGEKVLAEMTFLKYTLAQVGGYGEDLKLNLYGQKIIDLVSNGTQGELNYDPGQQVDFSQNQRVYLNPVKFIEEAQKAPIKEKFGMQEISGNGIKTSAFLYEMAHYVMERPLSKGYSMTCDFQHNQIMTNLGFMWSGVNRSNIKGCISNERSF